MIGPGAARNMERMVASEICQQPDRNKSVKQHFIYVNLHVLQIQFIARKYIKHLIELGG
jgi:hypothetical protein